VTRPTAIALGLLCLLSPAEASLARWQGIHPPAELRSALARRQDRPAPGPAVEAQLTGESEVYLDGRRCKFADVPEGAAVERLELAADRRTILRIDFSSPK
jgi:hypothetical protein